MNAQAISDTRSPGFWLRLARWVVIAHAVFTLATVVTGIALFPAYAARHPSDFTPNAFWTYEQTQAGLAQLGWPPMTLVWNNLAEGLLFVLSLGAVGLIILWRKSDDWFGLYLAFVFLGMGYSQISRPLVEVIPGFWILSGLMGSAGWQFFFILFYFFPDGRPVPGWTRWLALAWGGYIVFNWIFPGLSTGNRVGIPLAFGFVFSALGSQIFRFFWRSDPIQRQQTKWVLFVVVILIATLALIAPRAFDPPTGPDFGRALLISMLNGYIFTASFLLFPVAIVIAVLRYRLWEIDLLIRRTLQYSLLSGLLALTYFGLIIVLQSAFTAITGQSDNPFITVISTLAIAGLFFPLRKRVQDFIDRRFFRKKYDAAKVLAEFAATARDETDLDKLTARLVEVVEETMQPESVTLWLKPTNDGLPTQAERGAENDRS